MSAPKNVTAKKIVGEWEEVYCVRKVTEDWGSDLVLSRRHTQEEIDEDVMYYQTSGGGPEGGYFVKGGFVFRVSRGWGQPWRVEELKNVVLEYEPADEMAGKTARCRKVEEYSLRETRAIVDEHILWGNAIEIVKCLRDGLDPKVDASYKDLCLGIILDNFKYIDKYLDLLPEDSCPSYKEVLHSLKTEEDSEEESESEDSDSESEDENLAEIPIIIDEDDYGIFRDGSRRKMTAP